MPIIKKIKGSLNLAVVASEKEKEIECSVCGKKFKREELEEKTKDCKRKDCPFK